MILLQYEKVKNTVFRGRRSLQNYLKTSMVMFTFFVFSFFFPLGYQESFANGAKVCECYLA